ncbi:hypothetical protein GWA01_01720 [Gluconobacter wancherniae NBRC 103581]|uniref:Uncharacterized protein n=1 Tax=Gluconobacter wancherniae NBRC 103581 TaxID=656744 RepID=A0A511AXQ7_9PROT|nr:hypothetical protein AA103581_1282 [Gluconobacter wancherniae NBRC 103581]GEK92402.1 hypothetical protein GWA01_01720 [Gluconobacter wancherniae NBRC 103581]
MTLLPLGLGGIRLLTLHGFQHKVSKRLTMLALDHGISPRSQLPVVRCPQSCRQDGAELISLRRRLNEAVRRSAGEKNIEWGMMMCHSQDMARYRRDAKGDRKLAVPGMTGGDRTPGLVHLARDFWPISFQVSVEISRPLV